MELRDAIAGRRSIRRFAPGDVEDAAVREIIAAAVKAPAPHHTRPWRFVVIRSNESRARLAGAMGEAWRRDLEGDGHPQELIEQLLARSRDRIMAAPVLLLCCVVGEGLRAWPDERRQRYEWTMAAQSMGGALQNMMLTAHDLGLASYWLSAPLFCPDAVRAALNLPGDYVSQALVAIGHPAPAYTPRPRPPLAPDDVLIER
jgi:F420 biosynthesis protein FbiB-like protein